MYFVWEIQITHYDNILLYHTTSHMIKDGYYFGSHMTGVLVTNSPMNTGKYHSLDTCIATQPSDLW